MNSVKDSFELLYEMDRFDYPLKSYGFTNLDEVNFTMWVH